MDYEPDYHFYIDLDSADQQLLERINALLLWMFAGCNDIKVHKDSTINLTK